MNPKRLGVRLDPNSRRMFLTEQQANGSLKRIKDISDDIMLAFCADLISDSNSTKLTQDVRFSDGTTIQVSVELLPA